jgi:hypothetical protein
MVAQSPPAPPVESVSVEALDAGGIEEARRRQRAQRRLAAAATVAAGFAVVGAFLLASGGGGTISASARSRPPEPLPRLSGPALATPTHVFIVASNNGGSPFIVNVDRQTAHAVPGLGVLTSYATLWGPHVELSRATAGGAVAVISRQGCERCALSQVAFLIASDGSVRRIAALPNIGPRVTGTLETTPALDALGTWVLSWPHVGPCTLRLVPGTRAAVRVPCGNLGLATEAGVLIWSASYSTEALVNPLTGRVRARVAGTLWPIHGDLALENYGQQPGGPTGMQFGHLSLVNLISGHRRQLHWPSYFGDIIRVVPEPHGPLLAVDFGSPAYPGPAQAEDVWMLDTTTGKFTHLPDYPAQVDIKASDVVWTNDDRLVIVAEGGGRTVVGIWKAGQATLPVRTMPSRRGYNSFIPLFR